MNPVWNIAEGVMAVVVYGSIALLSVFTIVLLYIFVREMNNRSLW